MPISDIEKEKLINELVQYILDNEIELQQYNINTLDGTLSWYSKLWSVNEAAFLYIGQKLPSWKVDEGRTQYLLEAINQVQLMRRFAAEIESSPTFKFKSKDPNAFKKTDVLAKILQDNLSIFLSVTKEIDSETVIEIPNIPALSSDFALRQVARLLMLQRSKDLSKAITDDLGAYIDKMEVLQSKKQLHSGTFYGRSDQFNKLGVAKRVKELLSNTNITDRQKLVQLQTEIRLNRKLTGIPFFHDRKNDLASILRAAEQELITRLDSKPYERSIAKLETYINSKKEIPGTFLDRKASAKQKLKSGSQFGPIVIKSNQFEKLNLAKGVLLNTINKLNNGISREELINIQKDLLNAIKLNAQLTGSFPLHRKGALHEALTDLEKEIDNTLNPKAQTQIKPTK